MVGADESEQNSFLIINHSQSLASRVIIIVVLIGLIESSSSVP